MQRKFIIISALSRSNRSEFKQFSLSQPPFAGFVCEKNFNEMSGGSSRYSAFDDVTFEHRCRLSGEFAILRFLIVFRAILTTFFRPIESEIDETAGGCDFTTISRAHPSTKKHFRSTEAVRRECNRHTSRLVIHPYSRLR